ncbi:MAG: hypothetical protein PHH49_01050 [Candidatus Omnitrophica bacterium]|nr:hypothetical protein [Candidatus Omnitrophota bacterium]MDD5487540.1 hypothetical protein [Candidatus Omnitrophota bacterium]
MMMRSFAIAVSAMFMLTCMTGEALARRAVGNLYNVLTEKDQVKVYVDDIKDLTATSIADEKNLKRTLENALTTRMTINFKVIEDKASADIVIESSIDEMFWTDKDPVDNIAGIGPIVLDMVTNENYARMTAVFTVWDGPSGKELWSRRIKATVTSKEMGQNDSISMVNDRIVKVFMRDCFSKNH